MTRSEPQPDGPRVEQFMGNLLRVGVCVAAAVVAAGGFLYLTRHGQEPIRYHVFRGEPAELRSLSGIGAEALALSGRGVIQFGLLLLIATPVTRVLFSAFAFARERDAIYVLITIVVLAMLLYGLLLEAP